MAGQGLHPIGINHAPSADLYCKIIIPTVLYGAQLWSNMTHCDTNLIRRLQHFIAQNVHGFPTRTRSDICESMLGLHNISCYVDIMKLNFLHKLFSLPSHVLSKQLFIKKSIIFHILAMLYS